MVVGPSGVGGGGGEGRKVFPRKREMRGGGGGADEHYYLQASNRRKVNKWLQCTFFLEELLASCKRPSDVNRFFK